MIPPQPPGSEVSSSSATDREIERLLDQKDWVGARRLLFCQLRQCPDDHWCLTQIAMTYYEQHRYRNALRYSKRAMELAPWCPLVRWDYAHAASMAGETNEAIRVWKGMIRQGPRRMANGPCSEGIVISREYVNDSRFRLADELMERGELDEASRYLRQYLRHRKQGVRGIYSLAHVRGCMAELYPARRTKRERQKARLEKLEATIEATNQEADRRRKAKDWAGARKLYRRLARLMPESASPLKSIVTTYEDQGHYRLALRYARRALEVEPRDPIARWDYARVAWRLGERDKPIELWRGIIRQGARRIAPGRGGSSQPWARVLVNDCRYELARAYKQLRNLDLARRYLRQHLKARPHCPYHTVYLRDLRREFGDLMPPRRSHRKSGDRQGVPRSKRLT